MVDEGLATAEDVDAAVRFGFGFRYVAAGPILQKELAGLDTHFAAGTVIYPSLNNNMEPSPTCDVSSKQENSAPSRERASGRGPETSLNGRESVMRKCSGPHFSSYKTMSIWRHGRP